MKSFVDHFKFISVEAHAIFTNHEPFEQVMGPGYSNFIYLTLTQSFFVFWAHNLLECVKVD